MKTLQQMQEERGEIVARARTILDELRAATDQRTADRLEAEHDAIMQRFDELDAKLNRETKQLVAEARDNEARATGMISSNASDRPSLGGATTANGVDDGRPGFGFRSGWADAKGNEVRVLKPRDSWAVERSDGYTMADTLRALVRGPRNEAEKRALSEGTSSAGGYTVPEILAQEWIDKLRAQSAVVRAGARTVPMTSQTLSIARLESDPTIGWRAENADIATGDPTFGRVLFEAKSLAGYVKVSRELFDDSVNAGQILEQAFLRAMALELDRAAMFGTGADNQPTGIVNTSGINEVAMATNGAALSNYDKLIDAVYEMQLDNAADPTAMIMHPRTQASLAKLKDGQNNPLTVPDMIASIPRLATTAAPITETQGTATTASSIIFGDFRELLIGMRSEMRIEVTPVPFATNHQVAIIAHLRADVQLAHPVSFSRLKGITG